MQAAPGAKQTVEGPLPLPVRRPMRLVLLILVAMLHTGTSPAENSGDLTLKTLSWDLAFSPQRAQLTALSVDALHAGHFRPNALQDAKPEGASLEARRQGSWIRYSTRGGVAGWQFRCVDDTLQMESHFAAGAPADPVVLRFAPDRVPATLLGRVDASGAVRLPAVLHLPGMGSVRITSQAAVSLGYDAARSGQPFVQVSFPAADAMHTTRIYSLKTVLLFPALRGISPTDARFDGFRLHYLDAFQMQARLHVLANNSASDPCAFTLYKYADMARYLPPLAPGFTAADLVHDTLERYFDGFRGYGMPGFHMFDAVDDSSQPYTFLDVYPSLIIAAYDYVEASGDRAWLRRRYSQLKAWADEMTKTNADGSALLEYPATGNSGSWSEKVTVRPANWWDTIGFGHQDAYSNALGYRALRSMAALSSEAGQAEDAARYLTRAKALRDEYTRLLFNPVTGNIAGWRSSDGHLHDYDFTFVNGIAARYLLAPAMADQVMSSTMQAFAHAGYTDFHLGLPGNLQPVRKADYVVLDPRWGGPQREDGSDGFQIYENGGATACFSYFTLAALYHLHREQEADAMLFPMLQSFSNNGFSGRGTNGMTNDWKDWKGGAHGYEGFLVDSYYTLLAVLDRQHTIAEMP